MYFQVSDPIHKYHPEGSRRERNPIRSAPHPASSNRLLRNRGTEMSQFVDYVLATLSHHKSTLKTDFLLISYRRER